MYLSRFGVKNYKCLGEIDIPLTPIHVLIGQNDAGKSSLLEAIAALYASSQVTLPHAFPQPWTGRELVRHGVSEPAIPLWGRWTTSSDEHVSDGVYSHFGYGFTAHFSEEGSGCRCTGEAIELGKDRHEFGPPARHKPAESTMVQTRHQPGRIMSPEHIPGVNESDLAAVSRMLGSTPIYSFDAQVMALPAVIDPQEKFRLDRDGFGLPALLSQISSHDAANFVHLQTQFCSYFEQFKAVQTLFVQQAFVRNSLPDGSNAWGRKFGSEVQFVSHSGEKLRAQQVSDGAMLFLGFLALAHLPDPPSLLLIEEPENGIYPKRLGEVITMLKDMVQRTDGVRFPQIILSTHSPYVLSFFGQEEVTFLSRPKGRPDAPVRARPLRDAPNIKERLGDDFYLGELWYNFDEEDLFGEP